MVLRRWNISETCLKAALCVELVRPKSKGTSCPAYETIMIILKKQFEFFDTPHGTAKPHFNSDSFYKSNSGHKAHLGRK